MLPCPRVFAVESSRIFIVTRNEEFTVCLVRVDDSRNGLESVLVCTTDTVFGIGKKLKSRSGNLVATVETLTHGNAPSFECVYYTTNGWGCQDISVVRNLPLLQSASMRSLHLRQTVADSPAFAEAISHGSSA